MHKQFKNTAAFLCRKFPTPLKWVALGIGVVACSLWPFSAPPLYAATDLDKASTLSHQIDKTLPASFSVAAEAALGRIIQKGGIPILFVTQHDMSKIITAVCETSPEKNNLERALCYKVALEAGIKSCVDNAAKQYARGFSDDELYKIIGQHYRSFSSFVISAAQSSDNFYARNYDEIGMVFLNISGPDTNSVHDYIKNGRAVDLFYEGVFSKVSPPLFNQDDREQTNALLMGHEIGHVFDPSIASYFRKYESMVAWDKTGKLKWNSSPSERRKLKQEGELNDRKDETTADLHMLEIIKQLPQAKDGLIDIFNYRVLGLLYGNEKYATAFEVAKAMKAQDLLKDFPYLSSKEVDHAFKAYIKIIKKYKKKQKISTSEFCFNDVCRMYNNGVFRKDKGAQILAEVGITALRHFCKKYPHLMVNEGINPKELFPHQKVAKAAINKMVP